MNPPNEITTEYAESLVSLLSMMGDLDREALAFLVGHMASRNIDGMPGSMSVALDYPAFERAFLRFVAEVDMAELLSPRGQDRASAH